MTRGLWRTWTLVFCLAVNGGCAAIMGTKDKCVDLRGPASATMDAGLYGGLNVTIQEDGHYRSVPQGILEADQQAFDRCVDMMHERGGG